MEIFNLSVTNGICQENDFQIFFPIQLCRFKNIAFISCFLYLPFFAVVVLYPHSTHTIQNVTFSQHEKLFFIRIIVSLSLSRSLAYSLSISPFKFSWQVNQINIFWHFPSYAMHNNGLILCNFSLSIDLSFSFTDCYHFELHIESTGENRCFLFSFALSSTSKLFIWMS